MKNNDKEKKKKSTNTKEEPELVLEALKNLIHKGILEITPALDKSGVTYPDVEAQLNDKNNADIKSILEKLAQKGTLKSKVVDHALLCPHCSSPQVLSKFNCPRCNSENVELTQLTEHKKCGYIGTTKDFVKPQGSACPRCGNSLTSDPKDYRIIGNFYQCEKCGNRFDKPEVKHVCQNCGESSTFQDIKYEKIYAYGISEALIQEIGSELPILENIRSYFVDKGFSVKLHSEIAGSSGVTSSFAAIAEKGDVRIVFDVSIEGNKNDLVTLLAKKTDVNPTRAIILDLSGGSELTALGKIYGIDAFNTQADQIVPKELMELFEKYD